MRGGQHNRIAWLVAALSGGLLFAAFPPLEWSSLAFAALIPFLFALRMRPDAAARISYLTGLCFWVPSLWFLTPVTVAGAFALAAYCALYFIPVGVVWSRSIRGLSAARPWHGLAFVFGGAAWWCVAEWVRSWLFTGFPWNLLAVSQYQNLVLIQLANVGGTGLISFVIVSLNIGIALGLFRIFEPRMPRQVRAGHPEVYAPILLLVCAFTWGSRELRDLSQEMQSAGSIRVSVIQPNQENKWDDSEAPLIYQKLWRLSDTALHGKPDLLIWPETALPRELRYDEPGVNLVQSLATNGVPLIVGSLDAESAAPPEGFRYFNSSFWIGADGEIEQEYRKRHLVMFGEYIPFRFLIPDRFQAHTPLPFDVSAGDLPGVFSWPEKELKIGMLICFEDLMPYLSEDVCAEGADLLLTQTNDGWFDPFWGSYSHMAHSVFRCVEQGVPMVRCGNSGVSCVIDARGAVLDYLRDPLTGDVRVEGFHNLEVPLAKREQGPVDANSPIWSILFCVLSLLCLVPKKK